MVTTDKGVHQYGLSPLVNVHKICSEWLLKLEMGGATSKTFQMLLIRRIFLLLKRLCEPQVYWIWPEIMYISNM